MKILYFTGTGNCLYVAKRIGGELYSISKLLKEKIKVVEDDKIGIIFPCYCLCAPKIIEKFIRQISIKSNYIFVIMTYGNFSGAGVNYFVKLAKKFKIDIDYSNELLMIDNYLPMFDIGQQIADEKNKKIEENLEKIITDISLSKRCLLKSGIGRTLATFIASMLYNIILGKRQKNFIIEDTCIQCKTCEMVSPVDNIKVGTKPVYGDNCEFCLACINLCPTNSIKLKNEKSSLRFRNQNVSVNDIIAANN